MIKITILNQIYHFVKEMGQYIIITPPPNPNFNGRDYVDLGLPSGTLWATMNVGASKASDYGQYFQWGDTKGYTKDQIGTGEGKKEFDRHGIDYKWRLSGADDGIVFSKYTTPGATLELEDDAAHVNMGGDWHMPSPSQIQELISNTTSTWTNQDRENGILFTSKSDPSKSIFIPAADVAWDGSVNSIGVSGEIWSSMLRSDDVSCGQCLNFYGLFKAYANLDLKGRKWGLSIRGVIG